MTVDSTRQVIDAYFDAMGRGHDFGRYFAEQVVWTWMETGERISGREAVRDHIVEVHDGADWQSTTLRVADGAVTLEGSVGPRPPRWHRPGRWRTRSTTVLPRLRHRRRRDRRRARICVRSAEPVRPSHAAGPAQFQG